MIESTIAVALLASAAVIAGWRLRVRLLAAGGAVLLAGALIAFLAGRTAGHDDPGAPPDAWLVQSALAFNRPPGPQAMPGAMPAIALPLPEMAARLAARLEREPDDAAGWSLLAATYRQLGRGDDADQAAERARAAGGDPDAFVAMHGDAMGGPMPAPSSGLAPAAQFVMEGQRLRRERKFAEAAEAYRQAVKLAPGDADSWADLADAQAAAAGHDLAASRAAIDAALAIDPRHRKALWLRASLELQQGRYPEAAKTWRELQGLVQPGSADARVIAANIEEADVLAASAGKGG